MKHPNLPPASASSAGKYLTVVLADESYGIAVLKVREIICLRPITAVTQMPDFVRGVVTLRDRVIPVVDLRLKFGLDPEADDHARIVVVNVENSGEREVLLGLIVDAGEGIAPIEARDVAPQPSFRAASPPDYLLGVAKVRERVKALLDIDRALSVETLGRMEGVA